MIPRMTKQIWPLAFAMALVTANTSIMGEQPDLFDDVIFVPPTVAPKSAIRQPAEPAPAQKPMNKGLPTGKANLAPAPGTKSMKSTRPPVTSADPNRPSTLRQPLVSGRTVPSGVVPANSTQNDRKVTTASHNDQYHGVTPDGADPILQRENRRRSPSAIPLLTSPAERAIPPGISGAHLGLKGETATERLLQMRSFATDLERENEELRQQNAVLLARAKEYQDQLNAGIREIQIARKELNLARSDLDRLRGDLQALRDKVRVAEREYSAVLQSMGPLLQQLLEADDVSALPPNPTE